MHSTPRSTARSYYSVGTQHPGAQHAPITVLADDGAISWSISRASAGSLCGLALDTDVASLLSLLAG
eukprot:7124029-Pyramimonas_sp.AAC.1